MKHFNQIIFLLGFTLFGFVAQAATLEIDFKTPEDYTDISPGFEGTQFSIEDYTYALQEHLNTLASKLPSTYMLQMTMTDIDLAGNTQLYNVRVIKPIYAPRLVFSYQLKDEQQQVIAKDDVNITDRAFMNNISLKYQDDFVGFEKQLLDGWFKKAFATIH